MLKKRGYQAQKPSDVPLRGWWDISKRLVHNLGQDNLSLAAAGVAFYGLLAIFPALAALLSLYGYLFSAADMVEQLDRALSLLAPASQDLVMSQVQELNAQSQASLSISAIVGFVLTIWSSSKGAQAMITACNISYHESKKRNLFIALLTRFVFAFGAIIIAVVALATIGILPVILNYVGFERNIDWTIKLITWALLAAIFLLSLSIIYRYAPHRRAAKWRWLSCGALIATCMWVVASIGFSFYVSRFASYSETYGSLAGVVIMLMWLYISAYIVILGAAINASIEQQTLTDSTIGEPRSRGERGATVADELTTKQRQQVDKE
ncbi:YihY/virulence factor BrkB family protein [Pseudoalteromonas ruthenica]|uniref:YihY/virulence factor BrkB family protein n=1 Tax=Pseudoalteromonas ruthenica TaxID=151081 RepID=UPI00124812B9|nr:YihY/virulence factor BrkB family protein [Pseudoalteromonas ruthenica]